MPEDIKAAFLTRFRLKSLMLWLVILTGLYVIGVLNYLLFHCLTEGFSIFIAGAIFLFTRHSRHFLNNNYLLFIGISYLFIGGLDFLHLLAYKGMGVFPAPGANLATQLWIATRYMESTALLLAPLFLKRSLRIMCLSLCYVLITGVLLAAMWNGFFPACFIEGQGLTIFKKVSEYIISGILLISLILLLQNREAFEKRVLSLLAISISLTICAELAFTFYISVYGFSNFIGHTFKIISFYLIYRAIIETGFVRPYALMASDLKVKERALRESEERYRLLFNETTSGMALHQIICDESGIPCNYRFLDVNPAFEKVTGLKPEQVIGKPVRDVLPDIEPYWIETYGKVALTGESAHFESYSHELDRHFEVMAFCPRKEQFATAIVDITERKNMEEVRLRARKIEAARIFAGGIAHDLNNLLQTVMGNIEMALDNVRSDSFASERLAGARAASFRIRELIKKFITFSAGDTPVITTVMVRELIGDAISAVPCHSEVSYEYRYDLSDDPGRIGVDREMMAQAVGNVIANAREAMREGGVITIEAAPFEIRETDKAANISLMAGSYLRLSVTDRGRGISEKNLDKIFDPYFSTKDRSAQKGMGLGLTLAYTTIKKHGGHIGVRSEEGRGTTVDIYLKREGTDSHSPAESQSATAPDHPETSDSSNDRLLFTSDTTSRRS